MKVILKVGASEFIQAIDNTIAIMQKERQSGRIVNGKIYGGFVELQVPENLVLVGDLHGDIKSFVQVLQDINVESFLANNHNKIIFLGDYADRGTNSIRVLYMLCYIKQRYPNSVILMRGNHESPLEFPFSSHDLPVEIVNFFGIKAGKLIYNKKILPFFKLLVIATLIKGQLFIVHGGLPVHISETLISDVRRIIATSAESHLCNTVMEEILWNDPRENIENKLGWENSKRGFGKYFGIDISKKWLQITGTKAIIRGHEPCQGFKIDHCGTIMTLFSCKEAYPVHEAAYIRISSEQLNAIHNAYDLIHSIVKLK